MAKSYGQEKSFRLGESHMLPAPERDQPSSELRGKRNERSPRQSHPLRRCSSCSRRIAVVTSFVMLTWRKGRVALGEVLKRAARPLPEFFAELDRERPVRVPGTAVFMTSNPGVPLSLAYYFKHAKTLHETVVLLTAQTLHVPEVADEARLDEVQDLGKGFYFVKVAYGFMQVPDIPKVLATLKTRGVLTASGDVSYFLGRETLVFTGSSAMSLARKVVFKPLSQNALTASAFFKLPPAQVVELGIQVEI